MEKHISNRQILAYTAASLGLNAIWAVTTAFYAPLLEILGANLSEIGMLLMIPPFCNLVFQPLVGFASDRIATPWGHRLPYMVVGQVTMTMGLIGLTQVTTVNDAGFALLLTWVGINIYRVPYMALMSDQIPLSQHPQTTAYRSLLQSVGAILLFTIGGKLAQIEPVFPFLLTLGLILTTTLWTHFGYPRQNVITSSHRVSMKTFFDYLKQVKALQWLFAAEFFWWFGLQGVISFFVLFIVHEVLGIKDIASTAGNIAIGQASIMFSIIAIMALLLSLPVGRFASRYGKKQVLSFGLISFMSAFFISSLITEFYYIYIIAFLCGIGYTCIQIIPFTIITQLQPKGYEGTIAGLSMMFRGFPQLFSVGLLGFLIEISGTYRIVFYVATVALLISILLLQKVNIPKEM